MQTLPRASFKNNCRFQIKIILITMLRIARGLNIFTRKIKYVMFLFRYHVFTLHFPEAIKLKIMN